MGIDHRHTGPLLPADDIGNKPDIIYELLKNKNVGWEKHVLYYGRRKGCRYVVFKLKHG